MKLVTVSGNTERIGQWGNLGFFPIEQIKKTTLLAFVSICLIMIR